MAPAPPTEPLAATLVVNTGSSSHKLLLFGPEGERLWEASIDWSNRGGSLAQSND
jgi:acetate kinase